MLNNIKCLTRTEYVVLKLLHDNLHGLSTLDITLHSTLH